MTRRAMLVSSREEFQFFSPTIFWTMPSTSEFESFVLV